MRDVRTGTEVWDGFLRKEENYQKAMVQFLEFQKFRAKEYPSLADKPLVEDEVPVSLINPWLMGCDPEFVCLDNTGAVVNTATVIPQQGIVGWDHAGHVVEIRPKPAHGSYAILKSLQKEIVGNASLAQLGNYKWRAGAYLKARVLRVDNMANERGERILTLGGHVHIDKPPMGKGGLEGDHELTIQGLDRVTKYLEELDILPKKECVARRTDPTAVRNRYGQWGDWRNAGRPELGQRPRMEYRTLASWLYDPKVAYVCLTCAKLAAAQPQVTLDALKDKGHSWEGLKAFFEVFKNKDVNARRAVEKLCEGKSLKGLQVDPDVNFRTRWGSLGV